jgi:hypothetical protein
MYGELCHKFIKGGQMHTPYHQTRLNDMPRPLPQIFIRPLGIPQKLANGTIAALLGKRCRNFAAAIFSLHVGSVSQQDLRHPVVIIPRGPVQRRPTFAIPRIDDIAILPQNLMQRLQIAGTCCLEELCFRLF